jgi:hypothetical protein
VSGGWAVECNERAYDHYVFEIFRQVIEPTPTGEIPIWILWLTIRPESRQIIDVSHYNFEIEEFFQDANEPGCLGWWPRGLCSARPHLVT